MRWRRIIQEMKFLKIKLCDENDFRIPVKKLLIYINQFLFFSYLLGFRCDLESEFGTSKNLRSSVEKFSAKVSIILNCKYKTFD